MQTFISGETVGNGAAINVELGWIPDRVEVVNVTDGDKITIGFPNRMAIPFSGGGTNTLAVGTQITGVTSGATATIKTVLLYSGTWAGGDAAGFFIIERDSLTGTFGSENVIGQATGATDDATVTANVTHSVDIDTEVASATGNAAISGYVGVSASNAKGFTIGSTVAEEAKLLRWCAWRDAA
jgi:hypothetical protein